MTVTPPQESWLPERPEGAAPPAREGERAWPPWIAPVGLVSGIAAAFVGGILVAVIAAAAGGDFGEDQPPAVLLSATFVQDVALVAAAILFARLSGPVFARHFGLRPTPWLTGLAWAFAAYAAFIVIAAIWGAIVQVDNTDELLDDLGVDESTVALVASLVLVCVLAPLVEEFFFRGFFYPALRNWRGVAPAAIITGLIFGLIHAGSSPVEALLPLAVLGILLCLLYEKTGSLYPCIALHAVNNSLAFGFNQKWDWQIPVVLLCSLAICALVVFPLARRWRPAAAG